MQKASLVFALIVLVGCAQFGLRHFAGPILPRPEQHSEQFAVGDDHSITFSQGRLEIELRPLGDEFLNRQLAAYSSTKEGFYQNPYASNLNPYTYGDWTPPEQDWATKRFEVFNLTVKNYEFPKVLMDPVNISLVADNGRTYNSLQYAAMVEYYLPYSWANAGNLYLSYQERVDILQRTLYKREEYVFSGQEYSGYIAFPPLHHDVAAFEVRIEDVSLRFDYRNEPIETVDIAYRFDRALYMAKTPRPVTMP